MVFGADSHILRARVRVRGYRGLYVFYLLFVGKAYAQLLIIFWESSGLGGPTCLSMRACACY